jgi:putative redox protein
MVALSLDWQGGLNFKNSAGSPAIELHSSTPGVSSPPQALAYAVMACMAMDVVHVLQKGRHDVRGMTVTFEGERAADHPRRFVSMGIHFDITGRIDGHVVERAIELSRTTYCSVWNTIRQDVELTTTYSIRD